MKWLAWQGALLALVSGCVPLNKASEQVAAVSPRLAAAGKQPLTASPASVPTENAAAALTTGERVRDAVHREADPAAERSMTSRPSVPDLAGERLSTKGVPASTGDMPSAQSPVLVAEPAPTMPVTQLSASPARAHAVATISSKESRLPIIINGSTADAAPIELPAAMPTATAVQMINSKRIRLHYEITDVGPSGVSTVELWVTQDGSKWQKHATAQQPRPPFVVDIKEDGLYGFTLVARNGVGLGKRPPRTGEQPQTWVEVDTTPPVVQVLDTQIGMSGEGQQLRILWKASDNNLGLRPITLAYAEQASGPWTVIAANLENSGAYVWQLPSGVPSRILVRVEAADLMGNLGTAQLPEPMLLDLSQPSIAIVAVEPAASQLPAAPVAKRE
jgi:hypothetical protein